MMAAITTQNNPNIQNNNPLMDSTHNNNERVSLPCHIRVSLSSPPVAPPPSPLHEEALEEQLNESEEMKWRCGSNFASLADELSSSLATIAREERRKVQYQREGESARSSFGAGRESRRESEHEGGDASEESWLSFLGTKSASGPSLVTTNTSSGSDDLDLSNGGGTSNDGSATQQYQRLLPEGPGPPSDEHGLPKPVDDRVGRSHHNAHASVIASLPPPQLKSGGGGSSSSSVRSVSSCDKSHVKRAPPEIDEVGHFMVETLLSKPKKRRAMHYRDDDMDSSSSSGSDGGYDASSSDNRLQLSSCSSPSVSSSEDGQDQPPRREFIGRLRHGKRHSRRSHSVESSASLSSQLVDFSSSSDFPARLSDSGSASSSRRTRKKQRKRSYDASSAPGASVVVPPVGDAIVESNKILMAVMRQHQQSGTRTLFSVPRSRFKSIQPLDGEAPIFSLSTDIMAHCMSYMDPMEVHSLLTVPLSKQWRDTYTASQDLWRVLCLMEPFKAKFVPDDDDTDSESLQSDPELKHVFGKYRLLYTSFIRCLRYLTQIKDDAIHGRPSPSVVDDGGGKQNGFQLTSNSGLRHFLAKARVAVGNSRQRSIAAAAANANTPVELIDNDCSVNDGPMRKKAKTDSKEAKNGVRYGHSKLTQRLLGPSKCGAPGNVALPWSCAIYSIVNWMAAFSDVEGIQTMCLKVLPSLLEDEGQRTTAQNAGLTDIVLRAMVVFPDSAELHTAAFHTIVLLARPLGGREGMLFHSSMVNSSGIFNSGTQNGKSGIAVMLDSMHRFQAEDILQAMSCWSLVNIALAPSQKSVLVKLGGIQATTNAMMQHPYNAEVQFRSLFALINLVIPSVAPPDESTEGRAMQEQLGDVNQTVEKDVLDENVTQITNLVVTAMKHFCSSESILNRACLVLHNLSLSPDYHTTLLWTKGCYQMLEWCLANYPNDQVLQQSAAGTLHRLQQTMSNNEELRQQFTHFLQSQQQHSLEEARREAMLLQEQETLLSSQQADA